VSAANNSLCWAEEAERVSERSWEILNLPTLWRWHEVDCPNGRSGLTRTRKVRARLVEPAHDAARVRRPITAPGLRTVAAYEAAKGLLLLLVAMGLLGLVHRNVEDVGEELVYHLHFNPSAHYARIFLDLAAKATDGWLWGLAAFCVIYSSLRFLEAYGLWQGRRWAAWLGAASGIVYVPFEVIELAKKATWLRAGSLAVNVVVVAYLLVLLVRQRASG